MKYFINKPITQYTYNQAGERIAVIDAEQIETHYLFDDLSRLITVIENYALGSISHAAQNITTHYAYDAVGNRTTITNALNYSTQYTYTALNQVQSIQNPLTQQSNYSYDPSGNRTLVHTANGQTITLTYNALNRLEAISYSNPSSSSGQAPSVSFEYDKVGNRIKMIDSTGTTTYTYNSLNRLTATKDGAGQEIGYRYDAAGNRTHLIYPDGKTVTTTYTALNQVESITAWDGKQTIYKYNKANRLERITWPNGVVSVYTYDKAGRLTNLRHALQKQYFINYAYILDDVGNRIQTTESFVRSPSAGAFMVYLPLIIKNTTANNFNSSTHRIIDYKYDKLYRLTKATYNTGEVFEYEYDAMSNQIAITETLTNTIVTTYTYNSANQLLNSRKNDETILWHYIYDANGNLTHQLPSTFTPSEGAIQYHHNVVNQLTQLDLHTNGNYNPLSQATYNGDGQRMSLTTFAFGIPQTTTYVMAQKQLLMATANTQTTHYLYGHTLLAQQENNWLYFLPDATGSIRHTISESGTIVLTQSYKPFGQLLQEKGTAQTSFGFMGGQFDRISGLLYSNGRYYDPFTRRYLTSDYRFNPLYPRTLNPYAPFQGPELWLMLPLVGLILTRWRRKRGLWHLWVFSCIVGVGISVVSCSEGRLFGPTPTPLPPLDNVSIDTSPIEWVDEMDWHEQWVKRPNACGPAALYMFLQAEGQQVSYDKLIEQLKTERPGGYDGYCCSDARSWHPTIPRPTPDSTGWCNEVCTSAETLAEVARKYYGLPITSGDNWTRKRVHEKISSGHSVLALFRVDAQINTGGHFVVITGFKDKGQKVVLYDSYPNEDGWGSYGDDVMRGVHPAEQTPEQRAYWATKRRLDGEAREMAWTKFDCSWESKIDKDDPLLDPQIKATQGGHVRWAMSVSLY